jgi:hypothetical protein
MEVREFLASRRARITPEMAGLTLFGGRRRVPGPEDPGFTLTVFPAVPGSASDERLRLLASRAATERIQDLAGAAQPQDVRRP